jgi:16S rRNA C1402 N4-methylase RsmH
MNEDNYIKKGFDDRIVRYEEIHKIKDIYFKILVDALNPKPNDVILDGMDGYGSVSKWILSRTEEKGFKPEIFTLDESATQIERARKKHSRH